MNLLFSLYVVALFVALTPGVLLTLPKGGSKLTVAVVHGLVFATVLYFTYRTVKRLTYEGFAEEIEEEIEEEENVRPSIFYNPYKNPFAKKPFIFF